MPKIMPQERNMPSTQTAKHRVLYINDPETTKQECRSYGIPQFCNNAVRTYKYSIFNFIPKNLFEQFRRVANSYFLIISLLQIGTNLSPTNQYSTIAPLTLVIIATMIKEAWEDRKRHEADRQVNRYSVQVLNKVSGEFESSSCESIQVGDIIKCKEYDLVPADLLVLSSADSEGMVQVETSSLDGESNLKIKSAIPYMNMLWSCHKKDFLSNSFKAQCEHPNPSLYQLDGVLFYEEKKGTAVQVQEFPFTTANVALRGTIMKNTEYFIGAALYTGKDTKLILNSKEAPSKFSRLDRIVNQCITFIFAVLFCLCTISAFFGAFWMKQNSSKDGTLRYLPMIEGFSFDQIPSLWVTYLILYNNLVPISLYICLEFVKWYQAREMENDPDMVDPVTGQHVIARTSNINEDLGQISYLFTDKTGTLTCNEMRFRLCSVNDSIYGHSEANEEVGGNFVTAMNPMYKNKQSSGMEIGAMKDIEKHLKRLLQQKDTLNRHQSLKSESEVDTLIDTECNKIVDFVRCILLCHSVMFEGKGKNAVMKASSPDESALLQEAKSFGCYFIYRKSSKICIKMLEVEEEYEILAMNDFDSARKCMSIVVRRSDNSIVMYSKGADSVMFEHSNDGSAVSLRRIKQHVYFFASMGLRTLVLCKREIDEAFFKAWFEEFQQARISIVNREKLLHESAMKIEKEMTLLGATGVEDKLQEGVAPCIKLLNAAGIHIWMLTGDKTETAISVAHACGTIEESTNVLIVNGKTPEECLNQIGSFRRKRKRENAWNVDEVSKDLALVIDGNAIECLLNHSLHDPKSGDTSSKPTDALLELVTQCSAVIACRLSPLQKAQVVNLVKNYKTNPVTMAIGDGGNDVSMIQECHVGVGIFGHEGMQAVRAADFAIGQFRFIAKLILVHGRWNYQRVALVILYSFYKNMALILTLFQFSLENAYSGQTLYESYLMVGWNVLYTLMPIMVVGVSNEDITAKMVLKHPGVYEEGPSGNEFNMKKVISWSVNALWHAIVVYQLTTVFFQNIVSPAGGNDGIYHFGTMVYGVLVLTVTVKAAMIMHRWHRWRKNHFLSLFGSTAVYLLFCAVYSQGFRFFTSKIFRDFYGIADHLFPLAIFWLILPLVTTTCILVDVGIVYVTKMYSPSLANIIEEIDSGLASSYSTSQDLEKLSIRESSKSYLGSLHPAGFWYGWKESDNSNDPTEEEHFELSRILTGLERDVAKSNGKVDPAILLEQQEHAQNPTDIKTHPFTMEFLGAQNKRLEEEYSNGFAMRETRRVQLLTKIGTIFIIPYALFEYFVELQYDKYIIRIVLFAIAIVCLGVARTRAFMVHYQSIVLTIVGLGGMMLSFTITDTGKFGVLAFSILLFSVLRLRFVDSIILAVWNFVFYIFVDEYDLNLADGKIALSDKMMLTIQMIFIISFAGYSSYNVQIAMRNDFLQQRSLKYQEKRSTEILNNMLPKHVTRRLQNGETLICDEENDVTILFCDIVDFSSIISRYTPIQLVSLLDRIYSLFDEMCLKHGVQKMETVGKTYMACAGLQARGAVNGNPAHRAVNMALDMLEIMENVIASNGNRIKIRIGVNSGRVISGLVGMKKQQFSLFGDTVNTASRMQSTGATGRVQISQSVYDRLNGAFKCTERNIQVKGKGLMRTYLVEKPEVNEFGEGFKGLEEPHESNDEIRSSSSLVKAADRNLSTSWKQFKRLADKYDPFTYFLGRIDNKHDRDATDEVLDNRFLWFIDEEMEQRYLVQILPKVIEGSRNTMAVLCLYAVYLIARDTVFFYIDPYESSTHTTEILLDYFIVAVFFRITVILFCMAVFIYTKKHMARITTRRHNNIILFLYCFSAYSLAICQWLLWAIIPEDDFRFSDLFLDLLMVVFFASNGSSLVHSKVLLFNALIVCSVVIYGLYIYNTDDVEPYPIIMTLLVYFLNYFASRSTEFFTRSRMWLLYQTEQETEKAHKLLYQMLPEAVVLRLKNGDTVVNQHNNCGLLFSDIKGFTTIASRAKTDQVVQILDSIFSAFDQLTERHGVFKMQTIGDAYVIVSGLPYGDMSITEGKNDLGLGRVPKAVTNAVNKLRKAPQTARRSVGSRIQNVGVVAHMRNLIFMARDMHREVRKVKDPVTGEQLQMRIGLHAGEIIGGVIGTSTLRYDMWGPDVLTANEMESNGVPEKIIVSEEVKRIVQDCTDIKCTYHATITCRGRGDMDTFIVDFLDENGNIISDIS